MHRLTLRWTWLGLLAGMAACGDAPTAPAPVPAFLAIVSDAAVRAPARAAPMSPAAANVSSLDPVAYVSLAPGSVPGGTDAAIRNLRSDLVVAATLVDGGFDPVAVVAVGGDTLAISVTLSTGGVALVKAVVPVRHPPRVVRTDPPHGRTDVAINATIVVIFSEPVNPATADTAAIHLAAGGTSVPGTVRLLAGSSVGVEFVPSLPLLPGTAYALVLSDRIKDLTGDPLQPTAAIEFTTTTSGPPQLGPRLVFVTEPTDIAAFGTMSAPVRVAALDARGATDATFSGQVTLRFDANPGSATLLDATVSAANGVATFPSLAITSAGRGYTLEASATGFRPGYSAIFSVTPATAWLTKAPPPTHRYSGAAGVVNGILYSVGGRNDCCPWDYGAIESPVNTLEAYDPATDAWVTKAAMPTPRWDLATGVVDGILYAVGGLTGNGSVTTVEAYDPTTDTWTTRAPMPTPRYAFGLAVVGGKLYAIGGYVGWGESALTAAVEVYDPATDSWSIKAAMPTPRMYLGVGALNGVVYAIGGDRLGQFTASVEAYDPQTNAWSTRASMPITKLNLGVGTVGNKLYAVGGWGPRVDVYDPDTNMWQVGPPLPSGEAADVGVANGVIYAIVDGHLFAYRP